jgi:hypothetical protein
LLHHLPQLRVLRNPCSLHAIHAAAAAPRVQRLLQVDESAVEQFTRLCWLRSGKPTLHADDVIIDQDAWKRHMYDNWRGGVERARIERDEQTFLAAVADAAARGKTSADASGVATGGANTASAVNVPVALRELRMQHRYSWQLRCFSTSFLNPNAFPFLAQLSGLRELQCQVQERHLRALGLLPPQLETLHISLAASHDADDAGFHWSDDPWDDRAVSELCAALCGQVTQSQQQPRMSRLHTLRLLGDDERSHSMHVATEDARDRWEHADPLVPWDQTVTLHGRNEAVEVSVVHQWSSSVSAPCARCCNFRRSPRSDCRGLSRPRSRRYASTRRSKAALR